MLPFPAKMIFVTQCDVFPPELLSWRPRTGHDAFSDGNHGNNLLSTLARGAKWGDTVGCRGWVCDPGTEEGKYHAIDDGDKTAHLRAQARGGTLTGQGPAPPGQGGRVRGHFLAHAHRGEARAPRKVADHVFGHPNQNPQ